MWSYPPAGAAAGRLGLPRVCHLRDEATPEALRWIGKSGMEAVVCISQHIAKQAQAAWPNAQPGPAIKTILNPVVLPNLVTAPGKRAAGPVRRALGLGTGTVVFGFIGQLVPIKGVVELLEALAGLRDRAKWQLVVAGRDPRPGAPYEQLCRQRAEQLGLGARVRFLGFQDDVATFFEAIDVAVVPSLEEPLGRVPLEAGAHGRPSIAFATGGLPETIRHGATGWLVPHGDVSALRDALARFIEEPDDCMGLEARRWVEAVADPRRYVEQLAELYRGLLGHPDGRAPGRQATETTTVTPVCV
jgi:glycosyltransferase involved in cell wall biosynthesis